MQDRPRNSLAAWYPVHHGFEVQIHDDGDSWHRTGAIYSLAEATVCHPRAPARWRTMIITLKGERVTVEVDGKPVSDFMRPQRICRRESWSEPIREIKRPTHGYIGVAEP